MAIGVRPIGSQAIGDGATVLTAAYPAGGGTTYTISVSGAVTPVGALLKTVAKSPAGAVSSSGGLFLVGPDGVFLTGAATPHGSLSLHVDRAPVVGDQTLRAGFLPIA